jgi:hypothetical protein
MNQLTPKTEDNRPAAHVKQPEPFPFNDAEELTVAAQALAAREFANPQRLGCPPPGTLQAVVQSRQLPSEDLRAHLFGCSECFSEYRAAALAQQAAATSTAWRDGLATIWWSWRVPFLVGTAALLLLVAGLFLWRTRPTAPQLSQNRSQSATPASAERAKPEAHKKAAAQPVPATSQPTPELQSRAAAELLAINLDLNEYRSLGAQSRSSASKEEEPIKLPAARLRLTLVLREQRAAGSYRIRILDAADHSLAVARAQSRDGRSLAVTLNLRGLVNRAATLRIERAAQSDVAPDDYRLVVVRP